MSGAAAPGGIFFGERVSSGREIDYIITALGEHYAGKSHLGGKGRCGVAVRAHKAGGGQSRFIYLETMTRSHSCNRIVAHD